MDTMTASRSSVFLCTILFLYSALIGAGAATADTLSTPTRIGSSSANYGTTLAMPRWKGYMNENDPDQFWATFSNGSRSYTNIVYTTDGGETWSNNSIQIDPLGYLDMHCSIAGQDGELFATWPSRNGIAFRKFNAPAQDNADADDPVTFDGTSLYHRSNIMVEDNGRIWVFTRRTGSVSDNIEYHYSDDDGDTWSDGMFNTNASAVRFGSMSYVDGRPVLVVLYLDSNRGYEYYLWSGSEFEPMADHEIYPHNVGQDRSFTHNVVSGDAFHLVLSDGDELHHVWKNYNEGSGQWSDEIIRTSPYTEGNDWYPISTVRGDDLYLFYAEQSSSDRSSSDIYYMKWSQQEQVWTEPELVSTSPAMTANRHPNTSMRVPANSPYVPVFWQSNGNDYDINFAKVEITDGGGGNPPSINCPSQTLIASDCGNGNVCVPLTASNVDSVVVSQANAEWLDGQLSFPLEANGTFEFNVTGYPSDPNYDPVTCVLTVEVNSAPAPSIDCPSQTLVASDCGNGNVCVPLSASNVDSVVVNQPNAAWIDGQLSFPLETNGTFEFDVTGYPTDPSYDPVSCNLTVEVNSAPVPVIDCPTGTATTSSCFPSSFSLPLVITGEDDVTVAGATWSGDELSFDADTSGLYSLQVTATNQYGTTTCDVAAEVQIWPAVDLFVNESDIEASATLVHPGDTITLTAVINSTVNSNDASGIRVAFYDGDPSNDGTMFAEVGPVALDGGASYSLSAQYMVADTMTHELYVCIDPNEDVAECDEQNNEAMIMVDSDPIETDGTATIEGTVSHSGSPLMGVSIDLLGASGGMIESVVTGEFGRFQFDSVAAGDYLVDLQVPLGYGPVNSATIAVTLEGDDATADFPLHDATSGEYLDFWWWKRQLDDLRSSSTSSWNLTREDFNEYGESIFKHFADRSDGHAVQIEGVTSTGNPAQPLSYDDMVAAWFGNAPNTYQLKTRKYFLACLLNIAADRRSQSTVVTEDGATAGQAVTYFAEQFAEGDSTEAYLWYNLSRMFGEEMIEAGVVPLSTPRVVYKPDGSDEADLLPTTVHLGQNYPNPFNPSTTISFTLPQGDHVSLQIFNMLGREVRTLLESDMPAGRHSVVWDGLDNSGLPVASGIYLYRMTTEQATESRKMMLLK